MKFCYRLGREQMSQGLEYLMMGLYGHQTEEEIEDMKSQIVNMFTAMADNTPIKKYNIL